MKEYEYAVDDSLVGRESLFEDIDLTQDDDDTIASKVALRWHDGKALHDSRCKIAEENMLLFDGELDKAMGTTESRKYNSKAIKNVLYLTIRNLVGLSTDANPNPDITPAKDTPPSKEKARVLAASLEADMVRTRFQDRLGGILFDTWIKCDSFIHWFWNYDINDNDFIEVRVEDLSFAPGSKSIQASEYVVWHPWKNRLWWKENYPDEYQNIKFETISADGKVESTSKRGTEARFISYWENELNVEMVMGKAGKYIILKKRKNPYWEYRSTDEQILEWARQSMPQVAAIAEEAGIADEEGIRGLMMDPEVNPEAQTGETEFTPILNFFDRPTKPFVQIPSIRLIDDLYSKNLIAQIRQALIDLTQKKRQIADNLRGCNTKLVVDSNAITEEEAKKITDQPLEILRADFSASPKPVYFAETTNFPLDMVLTDMEDDKKYIDDVFGHHEVSRGSGNAGTLGQDQMNYESDKTPVRYQVRAVENAIVELWKGWIQLKKMFYTDVHYIKKLGATDGAEVLELMSKDIEDGVDPMIRPMSTAPMSKIAKQQQAVALYGAGALDPLTLFEDLGRNDPAALSNRLVNWTRYGMISADDPNQIAADMQNHAVTQGDGTESVVERADQENRAMQKGEDVPPTPPELVTIEHVKLHVSFAQDKKNKMEHDAVDNLRNHTEADKATLRELVAKGLLDEAGSKIQEGKKPEQAQQQGEAQ